VKFIDSKIIALRSRYPWAEIFLMRNELDYWMFAPKSGKRFSPDFLLFINDVTNKKLYYQCIFEVKWGHLLEMDAWKEEAILEIDRLSEVSLSFDDASWSPERRWYLEWYSEIKNIGYSFYNSEMRDTQFRAEFDEKMGME
jgi:type III restriction enzyme